MSRAIAIPVKFKYIIVPSGRRSGIVFMRTDFTKETIRAIHFVDLHEVKIYDAYSHNYYILISPTTIQCVIFDRNIFVKTRVVIKISHHHLLGYIFCKEYTDDRSQTPNNAIRDKSIYLHIYNEPY